MDLDTYLTKRTYVKNWDFMKDERKNKEYKKLCKNKTLIITTECKNGTFIQFKYKYDEKIKKHILEKYKDILIEIVNERFIK